MLPAFSAVADSYISIVEIKIDLRTVSAHLVIFLCGCSIFYTLSGIAVDKTKNKEHR